MFSQSSDNRSSPEKVWKLLGTFYNNLKKEDKKPLENFWDSVVQSSEAAYFSLYQADLQTYLGQMNGWFESLNLSYDVIFEDLEGLGGTNTIKEKLSAPLNLSDDSPPPTPGGSFSNRFTYVITSENQWGETTPSEPHTVYTNDDFSTNIINLSWDSVDGASSYKVYGRDLYDYKLIQTVSSTSYSDSGDVFEDDQKEPPKKNTAIKSYLYQIPDDLAYLYLPELDQLQVGIDYEIIDMTKIRFNAGVNKNNPNVDHVNNLQRNTFVAPSSLSVAPVLKEFYFPTFGKEDVLDLFGNRKYNSKDPNYDTSTDKEKALLYAKHLKFFTWAYSLALRKAPTMSNIKQLWALVNDYPFSYYGGTVSSITGSVITIDNSEETRSYDIGNEASHIFSVNDEVKKFDILCDGVTVEDYYSDSNLINNNTPAESQKEFYIYMKADYTFNPDEDLKNKMKKIAIPAGLQIIPL